MSDEQPPNFRVLKIVVVVLGIAILAMTGIIIVKAVEKFSGSEEAAAPEIPAQTPVAAPPAAFSGAPWESQVEGRIVSAEMDGRLLMLLVEKPDGSREVLVLDAATGAVRGQAGGQ